MSGYKPTSQKLHSGRFCALYVNTMQERDTKNELMLISIASIATMMQLIQ